VARHLKERAAVKRQFDRNWFIRVKDVRVTPAMYQSLQVINYWQVFCPIFIVIAILRLHIQWGTLAWLTTRGTYEN
jgi:hypothetical protein